MTTVSQTIRAQTVADAEVAAVTDKTNPLSPDAALATERFWSGGGGSDNISDSSNWFNGNPNTDDPLTFNNTTGFHHFAYFNYGDYYTFGHINIYSAAGDGQFYGNALKFTDYIKNNDNNNQWRVYNSNVSVTTTGSTFYVIGNNGGFYFKLDGSSGTGSGDGGSFYLDGKTMEVQGNGPVVFQNIIANGSGTGNVTANNSNTVTFSGSNANTYTGVTTISQGTLLLSKTAGVNAIAGSNIQVNGGAVQLGANNQIKDTTPMTLNGGRFNTGGFSEHGAANNTAGIGALTLQSSSIIDMGAGSSVVAFADSSAKTWSGTLSIYNWTGTNGTGDGMDQLYFGTNGSGLTQNQLDSIRFYSDSGTTFLGTGIFSVDPADALTTGIRDGEVVPTLAPVPEPSTWFAAGLTTVGVALFHRRRKKLTS